MMVKLKAVLLIAMLSMVALSTYAGDKFYGTFVATATPTGAGKVYVYPDVVNGPDIKSIPASSFTDTDEFTFEFKSTEEICSVSSGEIWIYAKPEQGCTFEGWALASNPNEIISTDAKFSPAFDVYSKDEENPDILSYIAKFSGLAPAPFISGATMICGSDEIALSTQSMVSVEQAEAIAASVSSDVREVTYTIYNMAQEEGEESKWVPTTTIASGEMSINGTAYAEFDEPITFAEGSRYMVTIKACDMDENEESVSYTIMGTYSAPQPEITPSFIDGENEVTLSGSEVSVESASAIKVGFGEGADAVKYATYTISEYVNEDLSEIASGILSINGFGYAEFQKELMFKLGTKYNIEIKAWDVYEDNLFNPDFSLKDPVATFTCDFIGAYEEQNDLDFTDKVVKEVKANTSNIEEGKWYTWSNPRKANNQYAAPTPFYDQGEGKKPVRETAGQTVRTVLSQNTPISDVTKYLVRFVKSGTGEAYHIQFATGNYIKKDLTTSATAEEAGLFMVYAATNSKSDAAGEPYTEAGVGINITDDGVAYGLRLDGNGAGAELVTWGSNKIETADANNVWFFEEVEMAEPTTETYTVHITGAPSETKVTYAEQQYGDSEAFDAKGFSLSQLTVPDHENYVKSVKLDGTDIYVTYTYAKKVADLSEINNEHAYVLICERGQLTTNEGALAPTAEKSYTESKSVFAFVKYNENFYLWSVAEQGFVFNDKSIAADGEFQNVVFNAQEDGTFVLNIADTEHYINIDGTTTLFIDGWDTADAGNKYSIYEVETFDATDALVLLENFTTGINAVAAPAAPAAIYSLTGQRQQRLQKGINIVRRQKVIK